ncbi:hypothetical protein [Methanolapillus ohkumae]|uniref:DUF1837 domain-containing protein n=1 Tax=Methanolapillus ohkumae TaxID=3028298 RepID=A0AA96V8B6_9EURY|nr:hypothetical protein MsAm2_09290 [Methanosarcinaceae archaeon Am2]
MRNCFDDYFVQICSGNSSSNLEFVKKEVKNLFHNKDEKWRCGAISEFFIHLYLNNVGFKQEFLYLNMEEGSIKKGFDGYYSLNNSEWIMESKSGSHKKTHNDKIKEAYSDIKNKVSGNTPNNPWKNAYNHACHCDVGTAEDIKKNIKSLSDSFINKSFSTIDQFNIIPCATIFYHRGGIPRSEADIIKSVCNTKLQCNRLHVICVNQKSIDIFLEYINLSELNNG